MITHKRIISSNEIKWEWERLIDEWGKSVREEVISINAWVNQGRSVISIKELEKFCWRVDLSIRKISSGNVCSMCKESSNQRYAPW